MVSISDVGKKGRGRPAVGATPVTVRVPPAELAALDAWIEVQDDPKPSRPEAMRRLVAKAIK